MSFELLERRRDLLMLSKQEPQDIVNVYNYTKSVPSGSYKTTSIWFTFKNNAIYEIDATIVGVSGEWRIDFLSTNTTVMSGSRTNWVGGRIVFTFKFTSTPANRFNVYVANSSGATATVKLTETIPHS